MFKLPIPTRLTDYLGEAVVWTVIYHTNLKLRKSSFYVQSCSTRNETFKLPKLMSSQYDLCQTDFLKKLCNHYIKNETLCYM